MKKIIVIALSMVLFSCSNNDDQPTNEQQNLNNSIAYFEFKLNNTPFLYQQENFTNPSFFNEYNHSYSIFLDPYYRVYSYSSTLYKFNYETTESISLDFHNLFGSSSSIEETNSFYTIFDNKPNNFLTYNDNSNNMGVSVGFSDIDGNYYTSQNGEQSNSMINYTSTTQSELNGYKRVIITGTINCVLYNSNDSNQTLNLTNGKFKLIFEESNL